MEAERVRGPQNDRKRVRVLFQAAPGMELQTFSNRRLKVPEDGMIELSAEDAHPLIWSGWTKLAELPNYELPGYDHNYIYERSEPEGPKRVHAVGSVEWQPKSKTCARPARRWRKQGRRCDWLGSLRCY